MSDEKQIFEVNGVKMEVDLRHARKVETYKIGDQVKVLVKDYSSYKPYPGVIVAFDAFENLPTIEVAYLDIDYSGAKIKFVYINSDAEDVEMVPYDGDVLIDKADVLNRMEKEIAHKEQEIGDLQAKRSYFERHFSRYFEDFNSLADRVDG